MFFHTSNSDKKMYFNKINKVLMFIRKHMAKNIQIKISGDQSNQIHFSLSRSTKDYVLLKILVEEYSSSTRSTCSLIKIRT